MNARRRPLATTALVALALVVPFTAGCSAVGTALDCARTATAVADSVNDVQQALSGADEDPAAAQRALDRIDADLDKIDDQTGNADVSKAVGHMAKGVDNARRSLDRGDTPDLTPVEDAASELTRVCTPG